MALLAPAARAENAAAPWSPEQWQLLTAHAAHTQGRHSYRYHQQWFAEFGPAQRAYESGQLFASSSKLARNLLDIEPGLRFALARLWGKGEVSPPQPQFNAAGEPNGWVVLTLTEQRDELRAVTEPDVQRWVRLGWMEPPDVLEHDQTEQARRAYWAARTSAAVTAIPAALSADVSFGDGTTPLTNALWQGDLALAQTLVARGASVHRCGTWGCPLAVAVLYGQSNAAAMVDWLLAQGARPELRDPRAWSAADNPLTAAMLAGQRDVAERLLSAGAAIDGMPQDEYSPLEFAVLGGRQNWAEWLVAKGASPLPRAERPERNLVSHAAQARDAPLRTWAERQVLAATSKHPRYRLDVAIHQGGRRLRPDARGVIALKPAPFDLVFSVPNGTQALVVGASLDDTWLQEVRRGDQRSAMFHDDAADVQSPEATTLLLDAACAKHVQADGACDGVHMFLRDIREQHPDAAGRVQHVRRVQTIARRSDEESPLSMRSLVGRTLHVAAAIPIRVEARSGATQLLPRLQTLRLRFVR